MRRWSVATAVVALAVLPALASARTQVVYAGGQPAFQKSLLKRQSAEVLAFFPGSVTIHVGDTIVWKGMSINFHTIDLPGPGGKALPLITPTGPMVSGANDAAGSPFWFNATVPQLGFNPALAAPSAAHTYTGSARVDAGLPFKPRAFAVRFTKAGNYAYFCDVHPGMHGRVIVLAKQKTAPSGAQIAAAVAREQAKDLTTAAALVRTKIRGDRVSLGLGGRRGVEALRMFQGVTHVKVGTTITFAMAKGSLETHTAAFGPKPYLKTLAEGFDMPIIDARASFRSSPPASGPIVLDQSAHGNGFANTGALADYKGSTLPPLDKITFTQKGTYRFECLVHPFMHGVVVVD
jgi:plastocyanin